MPRHRPSYFSVGLAAILWLAAAGCQAAGTQPASGPTAVGQVTSAAPGLQATLTAQAGAPRAGSNTLDFFLADAAGQPIADAVVTFDLDMTNMSMGIYQVEARADGAGHYLSSVVFSMPGPWRLVALIDRPGQLQEQVRFDFPVEAQ